MTLDALPSDFPHFLSHQPKTEPSYWPSTPLKRPTFSIYSVIALQRYSFNASHHLHRYGITPILHYTVAITSRHPVTPMPRYPYALLPRCPATTLLSFTATLCTQLQYIESCATRCTLAREFNALLNWIRWLEPSFHLVLMYRYVQ